MNVEEVYSDIFNSNQLNLDSSTLVIQDFTGSSLIAQNQGTLTKASVGSGLSFTNFQLTNTGVLSLTSTPYLGVSQSTGNITLTNNGVHTLTASTGIHLTQSTGAVTISSALSATGTLAFSGDTIYSLLPSTTKEPTGIVDRLGESTLSFNNNTRTFTISPIGASFRYWLHGSLYTKTTAESIQIPNTEGNHFIYYDYTNPSTLITATTPWDIPNTVQVCLVYWSVQQQQAIIVGDERHGTVMDGMTHLYSHLTSGTRYGSGLDLSRVRSGSGTANGDTQIAVSSGSIFDEDIRIDIGTAPFAQTLSPVANIPVFYQTNSGWYKQTATAYPFLFPHVVNISSGGNWSNTPVSNNNYYAVWLFATDNISEPIISILGQYQGSTLALTQQNNTLSSLNLSTLPAVEFKVLYRLIFHYKTTYSNATNSILEDIEDERRVGQISTGGSYISQVHSSLAGLSSDDHLQYYNSTRLGQTVGTGLHWSGTGMSNSGVLSLTTSGTGIHLSSATGAIQITNSFDTNAWLSTKTTSNLNEGSNLYYTDARARLAMTGGNGISYNSTTGQISASGLVTSITGTANQVIASTGSGNVTLSLPQNIATNSVVEFGTMGINTTASLNPTHQLSSWGSAKNAIYGLADATGYCGGIFSNFNSSTEVKLGGGAFSATFNGGNVGIGMTGPSGLLDVNNTGSRAYAARISSTSSAPNGYLTGSYGSNLHWNGSNWVCLTSATNNGGTMMSGDVYGNLRFFTVPSTANGTTITIPDASILNYSRMMLNFTGYVGIGTSNPVDVLHVTNQNGAVPKTIISGIGGGGRGDVELRGANGTFASPTTKSADEYIGIVGAKAYNGSGYGNGALTDASGAGTYNTVIGFFSGETQSTTAGGSYMSFQTTANGGTSRTEKMKIGGDGTVTIHNFVGIGTGSSAVGNQLSIGSGTKQLQLSYDTGSDVGLINVYDTVGTAKKLVLNNNGANVGIGTSLSGAPLEVYKYAPNINETGGGIILSRYTFAGPDYRAGAIYSRYISSIGTDCLCFGISAGLANPYSDFAQCKMVLTNNSQLGIGITDPTSTLETKGSIVAYSSSGKSGDYGNYYVKLQANYSSTALQLIGYLGNEFFGVRDWTNTVMGLNGNVGIGTTSTTAKLHMKTKGPGWYDGFCVEDNNDGKCAVMTCEADYLWIGGSQTVGGTVTQLIKTAINGAGTYMSGFVAVPNTTGYLQLNSGNLSAGSYSIQCLPGAGNYPLRIALSHDPGTQRPFEVGHYANDNPSSTWNQKFSVNSYNGDTVVGGTLGVQATTPTTASITCSNSGVGYPSSSSTTYANYRLLMYNGTNPASSFGNGIANSTLWHNVASGCYHRWLVNGSTYMELSSTGLTVNTEIYYGGRQVVPYAAVGTLKKSSTTSTTNSANWHRVDLDTAGTSLAMTVDTTNRRLSIGIAGWYKITFRCSSYLGSGAYNVRFLIIKNATWDGSLVLTAGTGIDEMTEVYTPTTASQCYVDCCASLANGDTISVGISSNYGADYTSYILNAVLSAHRIGGA